MSKKIIILVAALCVCSAFQLQKSNSQPVESIAGGGFSNLYKVNASLYRSEQPSEAGIGLLKNLGIKTVINFRHSQSDASLSKNISGITFIHYPINTWRISQDDVLAVMKLIKSAEKPVLVHCRHGSDRTGCMVASYRMIFENWTKDEAIKEFKEERFGYHETWFPNILNLLQSLEVEKLKREL